MPTVYNYEIDQSPLANDKGFVAIRVALSFSWEDAASQPPGPWSKDNCTLKLTAEGLLASLDGHDIAFPLTIQAAAAIEALDRNALFICAFDEDGDLMASVELELQY